MRKIFLPIILTFIFVINLLAGTLSDIKTFESGLFPRGIIIADINSDGENDVIVANFGEDTLIGQENDKNPTSSISIFKGINLTKENLSAGNSPRGLGSGDANGDNLTDFAVSNYADGTLSVFIQNEKNKLYANTISVGNHPVGVDINEGLVAVAVYSENKVVIFSNNLKDRADIGLPGNPTDVVIGKINDKKVIVSANYAAGNISIITEEGGVFNKIKDIKVGGGVCKVEIADVTGDKVNDIVTANFYDNTVSVVEFKNNEFTEPITYKLAGLRPNGMATGDVNGDGLLDVVTANRDSDTIDILLQKDGKLILAKSISVTEDENKTYGPVEVAIGDINGDGKNDIAFTHMRSNTLRIIYQEKPGSPEITSLTHPDENTWYTDNSPVLKIKAQDDLNGIAGFYYVVSKENNFSLKNATFTTSEEVKLNNLETGTWYFIAVTKDNIGALSNTAVFKLNIIEEMSDVNTYNFPNPCSDSTTIRFPLITKEEVKIIIYDINGKIIWTKTINQADAQIGVNYIVWNLVNDSGQVVSNGTYICKIITKNKVITKKIAVVK